MNRAVILAVGAAGLLWLVARGRSSATVEPATEPEPGPPSSLPWWATSADEVAAYQRLRSTGPKRPVPISPVDRPSVDRPPASRPPACATCG